MKRISLWVLSTVTVLVLLFSYHTSTSGPDRELVVAAPSADPLPTAADPTPTPRPTVTPSPVEIETATPTPTPTPEPVPQTFAGPAVDTRWGPVQVTITVFDHRITDVAVPVYPTKSRKDRRINSRALHILIDETIQAQSARIEMVSGATVTSRGYIASLQAALDQGLA